jgi:hypothetical protein
MFPSRFQIGFDRVTGLTRGAVQPPRLGAAWGLAALRLGGLSVLLAMGLSRQVSAQAIGTMQVTARVIPASASWAALTEAQEAARAPSPVRRAGLTLTSVELQARGARRSLVVTINYPQN